MLLRIIAWPYAPGGVSSMPRRNAARASCVRPLRMCASPMLLWGTGESGRALPAFLKNRMARSSSLSAA